MKQKMTAGATVWLGLVAGLVAACGGSTGPVTSEAKVGEYIVGTKRFAGPYQRVAGASREADEELGPADTTIELKAAIAGWDPPEFTVKKGDVVEIKLIGTDNGQLPALTGIEKRFTGHGFHVYAYDIWANGLRAGVERTVKFRASEAGTFPFECVVFCSPDHYKMVGTMTVTE
ncbi:MAG: cupredoxin domain-containing protein [Planctomycetota bacterium]|jgi:plastocyanin|nr:hypothetical protein [Deltaproteobacteria bacterium]MDP6763058.1 cupredoxin domain-containing protein [Planctomycetota bacterium]